MSRKQTRFFCIGSINIDYMYKCEHIVTPGESIATQAYSRHIGGKGLNQAVALQAAGAKDFDFYGIVGGDGAWIISELERRGFPSDGIAIMPDKESGHTIIQIQEKGENAVILHCGANFMFTPELYQAILDKAKPDDVLLVQGETNLLPYAISYATEQRGMKVVFNAAPYPPPLTPSWPDDYPCEWLVINRQEACCMLGMQVEEGTIDQGVLRYIMKKTRVKNLVVTVGSEGCRALVKEKFYSVPAIPTKTVNTTGAGDVFLGYFLVAYYCRDEGTVYKACDCDEVEMALRIATVAASLAIRIKGALDSIPTREAVIELYRRNYCK